MTFRIGPPNSFQTDRPMIHGQQRKFVKGIVSRATIQECGESLAATWGMPRPNATRDASTDEKETATFGFHFWIRFASLVILSALARSFPKAVPPPWLPTTENCSFFNLRVCSASRYTRVVINASCPSRFSARYNGSKKSACFGVRISIQTFMISFSEQSSKAQRQVDKRCKQFMPRTFSTRRASSIRVNWLLTPFREVGNFSSSALQYCNRLVSIR